MAARPRVERTSDLRDALDEIRRERGPGAIIPVPAWRIELYRRAFEVADGLRKENDRLLDELEAKRAEAARLKKELASAQELLVRMTEGPMRRFADSEVASIYARIQEGRGFPRHGRR